MSNLKKFKQNKRLKTLDYQLHTLPEKNTKLKWITLIVPLILTLTVYLNSLDNAFLNWDDDRYVTENQHLQLSMDNIKRYFSEPYFVMYIPLTMISFMLDYAVAGLEHPWIYHCHNLILHLFNTFLVWLLVSKLFIKNKYRYLYALFTALYFGIHPLHVESVSWIAERKDVLYSLWLLLSLIAYIQYIQKQKKKFYFLSTLAFIISLLAKTQAVVIPLLMLSIDYLSERFNINTKILNKKNIKIIVEKIPLLIISLIFGIIAIKASATNEPFAQGKYTKHRIAVNTNYSTSEKIIYASYSLTMYFTRLIIPYKTAAIHPYPYDKGKMPKWFYLYGLFPLIFWTTVILLIKSKQKIPAFGLMFFFWAIFIMLHIKNFVISEHYTYIPAIGIAIFMTYYWLKLFEQKKLNAIAIISLIIYMTIFSWMTFKRNDVFQNSITFWNDIEKKYPQVIVTYYNRGNYYQKLADKYFNENNLKKAYEYYNKALKDYNKAIELKTNYVGIYSNRGITLAKLGKYKQALDDFNTLIKLDSNFADAYSNRGNIYSLLKNWKAAIDDYSKAIKQNPNFLNAYYNRAIAYQKNKQYNLAIRDFSTVIKLNKNYFQAYYLRAITYIYKNQPDSAIRDLKIYLKHNEKPMAYYFLAIAYQKNGNLNQEKNIFQTLKKQYPKLRKQLLITAQQLENQADITDDYNLYQKATETYLNIIEIYGKDPKIFMSLGILEGKKNNLKRSVEYFNQAIELKPNDAEIYTNRGLAFMLQKKYNDALKDFNKAIEIDTTQYIAYYNRAILYKNLNNYNKAIKDLTKTLYLQPKFEKAYFERAKIFLKLQNKQKACQDFQQAYKLGIYQANTFLSKYCKQ